MEADMSNEGAFHYVPTRSERFWRWLGFRYVRTDLPDDVDKTHPGWMLTTVRFKFDWADRLRLLVSGQLHIDVRQATTQQVDEAVSAASHEIIPPFQQRY